MARDKNTSGRKKQYMQKRTGSSSPARDADPTGTSDAAAHRFRAAAIAALKDHKTHPTRSPTRTATTTTPAGLVNKYDGPYLGRRPPPAQMSDDPNGVKDIVTNLVGDYNRREVEQIMELQQRMDDFVYVPQDSDGGRIPDNGTDRLYQFQSNLHPIQRILAAAGPKLSGYESQKEDDSLINDRLRRLEMMQEDAHNNNHVSAEREMSALLRQVLESLSNAEHDNAFFETYNEPTIQEALKVQPPQERIEGMGTLEKRVTMFNGIVSYLREQVTSLRRMVGVVSKRLENTIASNTAFQLQQQQQATHMTSEETDKLKKQVEDLRREQEYLYYTCYGANHRTAITADRLKKHRKEIDETYKKMVEAEVAKKVVTAVKNSEMYSKRTQKEINEFKAIAQRAHLTVTRMAWATRTATRANRILEEEAMSKHDGQMYRDHFEHAQTRHKASMEHGAVVAARSGGKKDAPVVLMPASMGLRPFAAVVAASATNSGAQSITTVSASRTAVPAAGHDTSTSSPQSMSALDFAPLRRLSDAIASTSNGSANTANNSIYSSPLLQGVARTSSGDLAAAVASQHLSCSIRALESAVNDQIYVCTKQLADAATKRDYDADVLQVMCGALGETGSVLGLCLGSAVAQVFSVLQLLPDHVRDVVGGEVATALQTEGVRLIGMCLPRVAEAVLLPFPTLTMLGTPFDSSKQGASVTPRHSATTTLAASTRQASGVDVSRDKKHLLAATVRLIAERGNEPPYAGRFPSSLDNSKFRPRPKLVAPTQYSRTRDDDDASDGSYSATDDETTSNSHHHSSRRASTASKQSGTVRGVTPPFSNTPPGQGDGGEPRGTATGAQRTAVRQRPLELDTQQQQQRVSSPVQGGAGGSRRGNNQSTTFGGTRTSTAVKVIAADSASGASHTAGGAVDPSTGGADGDTPMGSARSRLSAASLKGGVEGQVEGGKVVNQKRPSSNQPRDGSAKNTGGSRQPTTTHGNTKPGGDAPTRSSGAGAAVKPSSGDPNKREPSSSSTATRGRRSTTTVIDDGLAPAVSASDDEAPTTPTPKSAAAAATTAVRTSSSKERTSGGDATGTATRTGHRGVAVPVGVDDATLGSATSSHRNSVTADHNTPSRRGGSHFEDHVDDPDLQFNSSGDTMHRTGSRRRHSSSSMLSSSKKVTVSVASVATMTAPQPCPADLQCPLKLPLFTARADTDLDGQEWWAPGFVSAAELSRRWHPVDLLPPPSPLDPITGEPVLAASASAGRCRPCAIAFAAVDDALSLWHAAPDAMPAALDMYLTTVRDSLLDYGGFEGRCEADALMALFPTVAAASAWATATQAALLHLPVSAGIISQPAGATVVDAGGQPLFRGLRCRIGIHWGVPTTVSNDDKPAEHEGGLVSLHGSQRGVQNKHSGAERKKYGGVKGNVGDVIGGATTGGGRTTTQPRYSRGAPPPLASQDITFAARVALTAAGGQCLLSQAATAQLVPALAGTTAVAAGDSPSVTRPGSSNKAVPSLSHVAPQLPQVVEITAGPASLDESPSTPLTGKQPGSGIAAPTTERLAQLSHKGLAKRHFPPPAEASALDAPHRGGPLYQWLQSYAAQFEYLAQDRVAFCLVEPQGDAEFSGAVDVSVLKTALQEASAEVVRLVDKFGGAISRRKGPSTLCVFPTVRDAVLFCMSLHVRALQLDYPAELLALPACQERYVDGQLTWKGLLFRAAVHAGRPDGSHTNPVNRYVEYYGQDVARAAYLASAARFGETILSRSARQEVSSLLDAGSGEGLGQPMVLDLGERFLGGETMHLHSIYPKLLRGRATVLARQPAIARSLLCVPAGGEAALAAAPILTDLSLSFAASASEGSLAQQHTPALSVTPQTCIVDIFVHGADFLLERYSAEFEAAVTELLAALRTLVRRHDGFALRVDGVASTLLFPSAVAAVEFATDLQQRMMELPCPDVIEQCYAELFHDAPSVDGKQAAALKGKPALRPPQSVMRGLRLGVCCHSGKLHAYQTGGAAALVASQSRASVYGAAVAQSQHLAQAYCAPGETVMSSSVLELLVGPTTVAAMAEAGTLEPPRASLPWPDTSVYKLDSLLLPGDPRRTTLYGVLPPSLLDRRRFFPGSGRPAAFALSGQPSGNRGVGVPLMLAAPRGAATTADITSESALREDGGVQPTTAAAAASAYPSLATRRIGRRRMGLIDEATIDLDQSISPADVAAINALAEKIRNSPDFICAALVQRVFRCTWKAGARAAKVIGYPVELDQDPAIADATMRSALTAGDLELCNAERVTLLEKIETTLKDVTLALACKTEKATRLHRGCNTLIIIPPDLKDESVNKALNEKRDTSGGKVITLNRHRGGDDDLDKKPKAIALGFRPGLGTRESARLRERTVMALEDHIGRLSEQLSVVRESALSEQMARSPPLEGVEHSHSDGFPQLRDTPEVESTDGDEVDGDGGAHNIHTAPVLPLRPSSRQQSSTADYSVQTGTGMLGVTGDSGRPPIGLPRARIARAAAQHQQQQQQQSAGVGDNTALVPFNHHATRRAMTPNPTSSSTVGALTVHRTGPQHSRTRDSTLFSATTTAGPTRALLSPMQTPYVPSDPLCIAVVGEVPSDLGATCAAPFASVAIQARRAATAEGIRRRDGPNAAELPDATTSALVASFGFAGGVPGGTKPPPVASMMPSMLDALAPDSLAPGVPSLPPARPLRATSRNGSAAALGRWSAGSSAHGSSTAVDRLVVPRPARGTIQVTMTKDASQATSTSPPTSSSGKRQIGTKLQRARIGRDLPEGTAGAPTTLGRRAARGGGGGGQRLDSDPVGVHQDDDDPFPLPQEEEGERESPVEGSLGVAPGVGPRTDKPAEDAPSCGIDLVD